ncbi:MAG: Cedratvirus [Cyanobacteriota bacterium]|jgi:hypothetical protein
MNKIELFKKYSESEVYLEEINHVYVHKKTGNLYNSVTTALSLLKSDFEKDNVIDAIINQYNKFIAWYIKAGGDKSQMKSLLFDYIIYGKLRPYERYNDKKIYKALTKYSSPNELAQELKIIKAANPNIQLKGFYLNDDDTVMTKEEILNIWEATNMLSRHYGHMIHESIELHFLDVQGFSDPLFKMKKIQGIQEKYSELIEILEKVGKGNNKDFFSVYNMDLSPIDFMNWIVYKFNQVRPYKNEVIVPEKVNFSPTYEICGTTDVEVIFDDINFEIEDHKTNKSFTFENEYGKNLKEPCEDMPETSFSTYGLQLNIYGHIQEKEFGRQFKGARITYFDRQKKEFELIELPIMLDRAEMVLKHFLNFQNTYKERFRVSGIFDGIPENHHNVLTKLLYEDIEKKRKSGKLDFEDKETNRLHYKEFVKKISDNLSKTIKG